jgi:pyruvate,water dikinase
MGWMPKEVRLVTESLLTLMDRVVEPTRSARKQDGHGGIDGIPASPGRYEGAVRVVADERGFDRVEPGDVLVCIATSPAWSVLFPMIGALVTDAGGILSHQAIIAREHGIPAVVATGNATELLRDGQRVLVDGDGGRVQVLA